MHVIILLALIDITDLRNTTYNETFISIAWKYLSVQNQTCEKSISYLVNISFYNNTTPSTNTSTSFSQNHILPNLISGTAYTVTVTATDGDKIGMSVTVVVATRKQDIPIKGTWLSRLLYATIFPEVHLYYVSYFIL